MLRNRRTLLLIGVGLVLLLLIGRSVRQRIAEPFAGEDGSFVITQTYVLDEPLDADLAVLAETITLRANSEIDGDVALVGERVTLAGRIDGDVAILSDNLTLVAGSVIDGDVLLMGTNQTISGRINGDVLVTGERLTLDRSARIGDDVTACVALTNVTDLRDDARSVLPCTGGEEEQLAETFEDFSFEDRPWSQAAVEGLTLFAVVSSVLMSLLLTGLSTLAVVIFPRQISHIEDAVLSHPRQMLIRGGLVLLLLIAVTGMSFVLIASLPILIVVLLPVLFLLGVVVFGMILSGFVTLALVVGETLTRRLQLTPQRPLPPFVLAAVGGLTLTILLHVPLLIPYGGWLSFVLIVALTVLGFGAALTTRIGTRPLYQSYLVQG